MTTRIPKSIAALADKKVTRQEWERDIKPELEKLPAGASAEARALLEVLDSDQMDLNYEARQELSGYVQHKFGYELGDYRQTGLLNLLLGMHKPPTLEEKRASNVSEADPRFADLASRVGRQEATSTLAIITPSGVETGHPALGDKLWEKPGEIPGNRIDDDGDGKIDDAHGWNFDHDMALRRGDGKELRKLNDRGLALAGLGSKGTDQVKAMPLTVGTVGDALEAIDYAIENGARVIDVGFAAKGKETVAAVMEKIRANPDVTFVIGAGDEGLHIADTFDKNFKGKRYLAANQADNLIAVASANADGEYVRSSNRGPSVSVAARGETVLSTMSGNTFGHDSGTALAAASVANLVGRCQVLAPELSPGEIKRVISDTVDEEVTLSGRVESGGVINVQRASELAALISLQRRGESPRAAADKLGLAGDQRRELIEASAAFVD